MKKTILATALGVSLTAGANALTANKNPFGLVYDGAITKNIEGQINIKPVKYKLNGLKIAANIYLPANYDKNKKYPTIVVAHPNGGTKEQVAGLYAQRLAENGYITIAADASYHPIKELVEVNQDIPTNHNIV